MLQLTVLIICAERLRAAITLLLLNIETAELPLLSSGMRSLTTPRAIHLDQMRVFHNSIKQLPSLVSDLIICGPP